MKNLVRILSFGNIFYGICAVFMCIESNLLQRLSINHFPFYLLIFFGSWIYYTMIYIRASAANARSPINDWYRDNLPTFKRILLAVIVLELALFVFFIDFHFFTIKHITFTQWLLLASIPISGALYTFDLPFSFLKKFRLVGWLKPLIIGYTWSGWITIFPIIGWQMQYGGNDQPVFPNFLLWLQNFLFITVLAIIFDVKDYEIDTRKSLRTLPAQWGIKNTYRYFILPGTLLCIAVSIWFQWMQQFSFSQIIVQLIPFGLLLVEAIRPPKHQSIFYYLVYIDGLMLLKAIFGIISIQYF